MIISLSGYNTKTFVERIKQNETIQQYHDRRNAITRSISVLLSMLRGLIMKIEQRLKLQALESCKFRGHDMKRFRQNSFYLNRHESSCKKCGMYVEINRQPMPNQIDIGGTAVALHCTV